MSLIALLLLCLANFCCLSVTGIPLPPDEETAETSTTTLPLVTAAPSIEVKIRKATDKIANLNKNIIDSLAGTIDNDAHSSIGTYFDAQVLTTNATANSTASSTASPVSVTVPSSANSTTNQTSTTTMSANASADLKFSTVLADLQEFENHLQDSIRNFTATRQFAYRTMLRPMLQQVQQLRSNLTHLRNHMIGFHAVTELQQQVNALTVELGDVITSGRPGPGVAETQSEDDAVKPLQASLSWVSE